MSDEPRDSSKDTNLERKEPSVTQEEQQKSPTQSSFLQPTEPQETSPLGDTSNKNNNRPRYDSYGRLIDPGTSVTSVAGSSQQVYGNLERSGLQGDGYDINPGGNMTSHGNSGGFLGDAGAGSSRAIYKPFEPRSSSSDSASTNSPKTPTHGNSTASGAVYNPFEPRSSSPSTKSQMTPDQGAGYNPFEPRSNSLDSASTNSLDSTSGNFNTGQSRLSGGLSPAHIGGHYGPTTSVGTSMANTSSRSNQESRQWTITKRLTRSDVNTVTGQLHLSKQDVERHLKDHLSPADFDDRVQSDQGIKIKVYDQDKSTEHEMYLVREASLNYLMRNWRKEFIIRRELKEGEEIGLMWDPSTSMLQFSVLSRPNPNKRKSSNQLSPGTAKAARESSHD